MLLTSGSKILLSLKSENQSTSKIARINKTTTAETKRYLDLFEDMKLVFSIREGRYRHFYLTPKGFYFQKKIRRISQIDTGLN